MRPTVLVVDDEAGVRSALKGVLGDEGYLVEVVESGEACLEQVTGRVFDLIILDIWLPGLDGLETLTLLRKRAVETQVVMISGHGSIEAAVRAIKLGAFDFLEKPLSLDKTVLVVRNALRQRRLEVENRALRADVDRRQVMVGDSQVMVQLREQIEMAAPTNGRVLIQGENGTGKELVARSVHALSLRSEGPFVEVNCAAIPEELIESELFGHVRGAFTGAVSDRRGKFELADGGTIFLDEVGDMSLKTQAKVLRVLEDALGRAPSAAVRRPPAEADPLHVGRADNREARARLRGDARSRLGVRGRRATARRRCRATVTATGTRGCLRFRRRRVHPSRLRQSRPVRPQLSLRRGTRLRLHRRRRTRYLTQQPQRPVG